MVLYRKYRPQKIAEIDSKEIREKLGSLLFQGRLPHAFLFCGPKGTGKTSAARIIAKSVNCEKNNGKGEPCNQCDPCLSITNGTNLDILEIDAASNRGIEEIRELREKIKFSPTRARKKVYIIDEVHMLTNEAFNALLKTLEEPPEHAIFILCTTIPEKLPETIVSRCQVVNFKTAVTDDLLASLKRVIKGEKREIEDEALQRIALDAEGSYRDAHKLLEEVLTTYPRAKITRQMLKKVLGEREVGREIFAWVNPPDAKKGLKMVAKKVEEGADFKFLTQMILNNFHAHLLKKYGIEEGNFSYNEQLNNLTIEQLKILINLFSQASQEIKTAVIPQLPLELAIVEWCEKMRNEDGGGLRSGGALRSPRQAGGAPRAQLEDIENHWREILAAVKPLNHSVAGLLHACRPASFDGETLKIDVFYKFHYDRLLEPKVGELLEKVAGQVFGKKIKVIPSFKPKS